MENERSQRSCDRPVTGEHERRPPDLRGTSRGADVRQLQRSVGNRALAHVVSGTRRLQRVVALEDGEYGAAVAAVLTAPPFVHWTTEINAAQDITLHVAVAPETEHPPQSGSTVLTSIDAHPLATAQSQEEWRQQLAAGHVTVKITIYPSFSDSEGDVKAHLIHELDLHARPIFASVGALKAHGAATPSSVQHRVEQFAHVTNVLQGEGAQHSEFAHWIGYLEHALTLGNADKQAGDIEEGSDLIMSAVNDAMTHATQSRLTPLMSLQGREALFDNANRIGLAEAEFQRQHPEIWGRFSPGSPVDAGLLASDP